MSTHSVAPSTLQDELEAAGVNLNDGDASGYIELDSGFNLNAIALGLGLENIEYEPEKFPGLIYHLDQPTATVMVFGSGVLTTIDGSDEDAVVEALNTTLERLEDLGLHATDSSSTVEVDIETIPIAEELEREG